MRLAASLLLAGLCFSQTGRPTLPGSPMAGLSPSEQERFRIGLADFTDVETAEDGLGPAFNGHSCAVCHSIPAIGGVSSMTEVRAGYRDADGKFTAMNGGTLYHLFSTPPHRCQAQIPIEANVIARRAPIPLFGAGLIETIDDATLLALEDPDDRDNDGVRGRAARITDIATRRERIGRFGWKAQHATLLSFSGDAYRNEMGITNDLFPTEDVLGFTPEQLKLCGAKGNIEDARDDDSVRAGETLFSSVGRATCHTPLLMTGQNANRASTASLSLSSPTCCCMTSARATASSSQPPAPTRSARLPCGDSVSAALSFMTAQPPLRRTPSVDTARKPLVQWKDSRRCPGPFRSNCWPS